ncbi:hypothetical protein [Desulfopila sp. IMCC35008]|uniref:hypothetical protein n=1 Tax=Desulfopila sp. IMCC35008 TaxID=2653858 RepID=UPI0013D7D52B|nr:hypothetical protein [Desulfopila sp. IMCC35008]
MIALENGKWKLDRRRGQSGYSALVVLLIYSLLMMSGCATVPGRQVADGVAPLTASNEFQQDELLNVSIKVFDPGVLPRNPDQRRGLSMEIREAESRFVPVHLKHTLQHTGYWGAVRVVPDDDLAAEVLVRGKIEYSDGESAVLSVEVVDSSNIIWFRKTYAETARIEEHHQTEAESRDTFQDLFNSVANDMALYRKELSRQQVQTIRNLAELRYASSMAPDTFSHYLENQEGVYAIRQLPAHNDPMIERVRSIKTRDDMLVDAINDYYDMYYLDLWEPYSSWRMYRHEEVETMRTVEREALAQQVLGVAAIVGAIALGVSSDIDTSVRTQPLQDIMMMGGAYALYSGHQKRQEGQLNKVAIEELGDSFSSEAEPLTMEVEGQTVRLTGSAEQQYSNWRRILRDIYAKETGLQSPVNPSALYQ